MVTPRSSDAPQFPNTSTQWRSAIYAILAVSRFQNTSSPSAHQQRSRGFNHLQSETQTTQNGSPSEYDDTYSAAIENQETNQAAQLDPSEDQNPEIEVLKLIRDELVKQLDAYGLVLILLAGITFVPILQPPGSFKNGKLRKSLLVSYFLLLATLSFFIACTGLGAVMVGCAQLFRPVFYPKLAKYTGSQSLQLDRVPTQNSPSTETLERRGFRNWLPGCSEIRPGEVAFDNVYVLGQLCVENVYRIRRIRFYLGVALVLCIAAYICGALAVMVTNDRRRYLLVGAMGAGGVILMFELCITVSAAMQPESKSMDGSDQPELQRQLRDLTKRFGGHPDTQTLPSSRRT